VRNIYKYLLESIKPLPNGKRGIIVFDIDDTLLRVDNSSFFIYKQLPNGKEQKLTTAQFAKDPDAGDPAKRYMFDLRDFRDEQAVYNSIVNGTPIIKNLKILDAYINAGYDFCFLTARGCEDVIKTALYDYLEFRNKETGALQKLGSIFKKTLSHAINDEVKSYKGYTDAEKKANVLRSICKKYDHVVFVDDDMKNVKAANELGIKNLKVVKAWKE